MSGADNLIRRILWYTQENIETQVPVIIVLTQSYIKKDAETLKKTLENENLDVIQIIPVLAEEAEIEFDEETKVISAFGKEQLVKVMEDVLPSKLKDTLMHVQIASLTAKKRKAKEAITVAAAAAAATGAIPIPFSDAPLLIADQITMLVSITVIFGLPVDKTMIAGVLSATIGTGGTTILGKTAVANILKLIPGVGSVVGGLISAGVATTITTALGEAYLKIMERMFNKEHIENINEEVKVLFSKKMQDKNEF